MNTIQATTPHLFDLYSAQPMFYLCNIKGMVTNYSYDAMAAESKKKADALNTWSERMVSNAVAATAIVVGVWMSLQALHVFWSR